MLAPGGRFLIWRSSVPERLNGQQAVRVVPLVVPLLSTAMETGYSVQWPDEPFGLSHYVELAEQAGFDVIESRDRGQVFYLEFRRA